MSEMGTAMGRLREVCVREVGWLTDEEGILRNDSEYIAATEKCVIAFKKLQRLLTDEQVEVLFGYESALAERDCITYTILGGFTNKDSCVSNCVST